MSFDGDLQYASLKPDESNYPDMLLAIEHERMLAEQRYAKNRTKPDSRAVENWLNTPSAQEHTLLGTAIGGLRNVFDSPKTDQEKIERAQSDDSIAHLVADVFVAVPRVRPVMSGIIRAALLFDPSPQAFRLTVSIAEVPMNFMAGVGMNLLARSTSYGSIKAALAPKLTGLEAEIAQHAVAGAGFAALRTAGDVNTWAKPNSLHTVFESAVVGGVMNVPASMIGARVYRPGVMPNTYRESIMGATTSGAATGAVFGFTDALNSTGSLTQAGKGFFEGMAVGALAGGATAGLEGGRQHLAHKYLLQETTPSEEFTGPLLETSRNIATTNVPDLRLSDELSGTLTYLERARLLPPPEKGRYREHLLDPFGPREFYSEGQYESYVDTIVKPSMVYRVGSTFISVPTEYAARLDEVRQLRIASETINPLLEKSSPTREALVGLQDHQREQLLLWAKTAPQDNDLAEFVTAKTRSPLFAEIENPRRDSILEASSQSARAEFTNALETSSKISALGKHPLRNRILPEDLIPVLQGQPAPDRLRKVWLLDSDYAWNKKNTQFSPWQKMHNANGWKALASAHVHGGDITLYKASAEERRSVGSLIDHEQVHTNQSEGEIYKAARALDSKMEASTYGYATWLESEAELESLAFLGPKDLFAAAVNEAPVRMSLIASKLDLLVNDPAAVIESTRKQQLLDRVAYVYEHARPEANNRIAQAVRKNEFYDQKKNTAKLFAKINNYDEGVDTTTLFAKIDSHQKE